MRAVVALACALAPACGGAGSSEADDDEGSSSGASADDDGPVHEIPVDLVVPELWVAADATADPVAMHRPPTVDCAIGFKDELGVFEVDTALCNYGVFVQPTLVELGAGELVELVFTHDDLLAPEPAAGHVAIAIGGRLVWEIWVEIPKPYGLVQGEWITDMPIPAGTPVAYHVHNHGYNNWRIISIKASTP